VVEPWGRRCKLITAKILQIIEVNVEGNEQVVLKVLKGGQGVQSHDGSSSGGGPLGQCGEKSGISLCRR